MESGAQNLTKQVKRNIKNLEIISRTALAKFPEFKEQIDSIKKLYGERKIRNYDTAKRMINNITSVTDKVRAKAVKEYNKKAIGWEKHGVTTQKIIPNKEITTMAVRLIIYRKPTEEEEKAAAEGNISTRRWYERRYPPITHGTFILDVPSSHIGRVKQLIEMATGTWLKSEEDPNMFDELQEFLLLLGRYDRKDEFALPGLREHMLWEMWVDYKLNKLRPKSQKDFFLYLKRQKRDLPDQNKWREESGLPQYTWEERNTYYKKQQARDIVQYKLWTSWPKKRLRFNEKHDPDEEDIVESPEPIGVLVLASQELPNATSSYRHSDARFREAEQQIGMSNKYIITELNHESTKFAEAMQQAGTRPNECWINALFQQYGDTILSQEKSERYRVTREKLIYDILKLTEEDVKQGLTFEQIKPFFEYFKVQLRVYDDFGEIVYRYDLPANTGRHNTALYCVCKNNHIYTCNYNIKELQQRKKEVPKLNVSEYFRFPDPEPMEPYVMFKDLDEMLSIIKDAAAGEEETVDLNLIHYDDDLLHVCAEMIKAGYHPYVQYSAHIITSLQCDQFKVGNTLVRVHIKAQRPTIDINESTVVVDTADEFNRQNEARHKLRTALFKREHVSAYSLQDSELLKSCRSIANLGKLQEIEEGADLVGIDMTKAYTYCLTCITKVPVFTSFDTFRKYDGHEIEDYTIYITRTPKDNNMFFNKEFNLAYGIFLKEELKHNPNAQIHLFNRPSNIKDVDYKALIEELYATKLSDTELLDKQLKKNIANELIGTLGKRINKRSFTRLYQVLPEALYYKEQHGGEIYPVRATENDDVFYLLTQKKEARLKNGFKYIHELIIQRHNHMMADIVRKLEDNGIPVYSIRTDELLIEKYDLKDAMNLLQFDAGIGSMHYSGGNRTVPTVSFMAVPNQILFNEQIPINKLHVADEWDTPAICEQIKLTPMPTIVRARFPGAGKSYICKYFEQLGHKVLFVCPTNKLAQNNNGITLHSLFGMAMEQNRERKCFDTSAYHVIVFEEVYMCEISMLARIKHFVQEHPDKLILATGDCNQLEAVGNHFNNIHDVREYTENALNQIFSNEIYLNTCKRLTSEEDRKRLIAIEKDILYSDLSLSEIIRKHFKTTKEMGTTYNIAYLNQTCLHVGNDIRKKLGKQAQYEVGEVLVCRKYKKLKKHTLHVNYEYVIKEIGNDTITISELGEEELIEVKLNDIKNHFIYNYCRTCHSWQGGSIGEKLTVYDWHLPYMSRYWLWTCITRATNLDNLYFYINDRGNSKLEYQMINQYLQQKAKGYRSQDTKANRSIDESIEYVTVDWLSKQFGLPCCRCGNTLSYDIQNGFVSSNLTADRVDNTLPHYLSNVRPLCCECNCAKSDN